MTCKDKSGKWGVLNNSQKIVTNFKQVSFGDDGTVNVKTSSHHGGYAMVIRQINDGDLRVEGVKCSKGTITLKGGLQAVGKLPIRNYYVKLGVWAAGVTLKGGSRTASKCVRVGSSTAKLGYTVSSAGKPTLKTGTQSREIVQKIAADRRMCSADGTGRGIDKCWSYQIYRVEMKRG